MATLVSLFVKAAGAAAVFLVTFFVARRLSVDEAGLFFLALTVMTVTATICRFGLENTLVRYIAQYNAMQRPGLLAGMYRLSLRWTMFISIPVACGMWLLADMAADRLFNNPQMSVMLRTVAIVLPAFNFMMVNAQSLQGLKWVSLSTISLNLAWAAFFLLLLAVVGAQSGLDAIVLYCGAVLAASILSYALWYRVRPRASGIDYPASNTVLASSFPLWWVQLVSLVNVWVPPLLLGLWYTPDNVAIFTVSLRLAMLVSFVLVAVNAVVAPRFSELYSQGRLGELSTLGKNTALLLTLCSAPVFLLVFCFPEFLLRLMGEEYVAGVPVLRLLALGELVSTILGPVGYLLIMSGNERVLRNNLFIGGGLALTIGALAIPSFGMIGAALATFVGASVSNLVSAYMVYRRLGFWALPGVKKIVIN